MWAVISDPERQLKFNVGGTTDIGAYEVQAAPVLQCTVALPLLWPSVAISLTVLAFNLLGDGLRDLLDPRLRS